jgi:hypothetical protein
MKCLVLAVLKIDQQVDKGLFNQLIGVNSKFFSYSRQKQVDIEGLWEKCLHPGRFPCTSGSKKEKTLPRRVGMGRKGTVKALKLLDLDCVMALIRPGYGFRNSE